MSALPAAVPPEFCERLARLLSPQAQLSYWEAFHAVCPTAFRINTLKADPAAVLSELADAGLQVTPLEGLPLAHVVPHQQRRALTETAAFAEGRLFVQNPSSMLPPLILDPRPQDWILDLTAAPGSKTLQLAAMMGNRGRISAVDSVRSRFHRLRRNLELGGASNVSTYLRDGASVWRVCPERFDRVLLDAPCSGEGRFRAGEPRSHAFWSVKKVQAMARKQRRLLFSAVQCLKPGGRLVYSTCTLAPEENEAVVSWALRRFPEALSVEPVELEFHKALPGLQEWDGVRVDPSLGQALRILPGNVLEGFFICQLRKSGSTACD